MDSPTKTHKRFRIFVVYIHVAFSYGMFATFLLPFRDQMHSISTNTLGMVDANT